MDYSVRIGGEAGQGMQTIGDTLARIFARCGYHVFTHQDYESRIRGGHNYYQLRFSDSPALSPRASLQIAVALDRESIIRHAPALSEGGQLIYDSETLKEKHTGPAFMDIPFVRLATEHGGSRIMENIVATGAVLGLLGIDIEILFSAIRETFGTKGSETVELNINAARAGYRYAAGNCPNCAYLMAGKSKQRMLISGTEAIGLGAIASGVKFYSAYPMTPATGVMNYISGKANDFGIIVEQAEDEIAAINMALGASFGGVRAMTGSSGGGFALMVEGISLAGITETPVVIALAQRPGPATGLPTKTEQADLMLALYAGHGEFPRVLFAPGTPEQAFYLTNKAFDLAEKYQIPAIILFDQYLGDTQWTCSEFDTTKLVYNDYRLRGKEFSSLKDYKRHALTSSGISPMAVPGDGRHVVVTDSDEHTEDGHLTEDAAMRNAMMQKRLFAKQPLIEKEIAPPVLYGSGTPEIVLAGWGSTYGLMKETVDSLSKKHNIAMLHFSEIYPLPLTDRMDYMSILNKARLSICFEQNATSQFARLLKSETGFSFTKLMNRFDGRPYMLEEFIGETDAIIG